MDSLPKLQFKANISRSQALQLVLMMAKESDNSLESNGYIIKDEVDLRVFLERHHNNYNDFIEKARIPNNPIEYFENLAGNTMFILSGEFALKEFGTDRIITQAKGPGIMVWSTYLAHFEEALELLNQATKIDTNAYSKLLSALDKGIASIEGFIEEQVKLWNQDNPSSTLIDSKHVKVSFDDKIDAWIPLMTGGKSLDKSIRNWQDFKRLRGLRDKLSIHPKESGYSINYHELSDLINIFRTGIAGILIQLHRLFDVKIPSKIVRSYYGPDVEVVI